MVVRGEAGFLQLNGLLIRQHSKCATDFHTQSGNAAHHLENFFEFPGQLFNVVKGDLSLVGPRALIPQELGQAEKRHAILSVKSGLTGLAQVSGRRSIDFNERRQLDVYYVQNWSFWLDLVILIKTVKVVIRGEG